MVAILVAMHAYERCEIEGAGVQWQLHAADGDSE